MPLADLISYAVTLFAISIAPGPVVLMMLVRAAGDDVRGATAFGLGFALGGVVIITAVCFGLGAWFAEAPEAFEYSKYIMMAYILFLARGVWRGGFDLTAEDVTKRGSFLSTVSAGAMTCFISPYMMVLFPLVLPGLTDVTAIKMPDFLFIALLTFGAIVAASAVVIAFAAQVRRLVRSPCGAARLNKGLAGLLVVGGATLAFG